ncbi:MULTISPECIES: hypothetical protein [unclassified Nonomuraea]|uniref:hypothetical protein n=1 Tax=unclassified Nonomuraea TaxID=2593643 RepID=UPI0033E26C43
MTLASFFFALGAALAVAGCFIAWRIALRAVDKHIYAAREAARLLRVERDRACAQAMAYGDALNDIVDLADWSSGLPAARAIAKQALEAGAYPGRLRAAQEALQEAEREIQELMAENMRLAYLAVEPQ